MLHGPQRKILAVHGKEMLARMVIIKREVPWSCRQLYRGGIIDTRSAC